MFAKQAQVFHDNPDCIRGMDSTWNLFRLLRPLDKALWYDD